MCPRARWSQQTSASLSRAATSILSSPRQHILVTGAGDSQRYLVLFMLFMCRLSGYQDTLTSSHHNHNPPSSLTTAHCWSLIPPPLPRIIPVRLLADEERILRLEHESCKELPWDPRLLPSSRLPSFIHPLLAAIPSPATTTYQ